jgi:hypothetical protein
MGEATQRTRVHELRRSGKRPAERPDFRALDHSLPTMTWSAYQEQLAIDVNKRTSTRHLALDSRIQR